MKDNKKEEQKKLDSALEDTFPASDPVSPPSSLQPSDADKEALNPTMENSYANFRTISVGSYVAGVIVAGILIVVIMFLM